MSAVATRTVCKYGHDLSADTAVYVESDGRRRCRTCVLARMSIRYTQTRRAYRGERRGQVQPWKFRKWAENTWAEMSDWDRFIVVQGLKAIMEDNA